MEWNGNNTASRNAEPDGVITTLADFNTGAMVKLPNYTVEQNQAAYGNP